MLRMIIADDHAIVRKGLVQILEIEENLELSRIDEADSGLELLEKLRRDKYDLIILDISMPGKDGLETLKDLRNEHPMIPVLILSTHSEEQYAIRVLKAGAMGYVRKNNQIDELVTAIQTVTNGRRYFSPEVTEKILAMDSRKLPHEILSDREFQVMTMLAKGKTQKEIAEEIFLSIKTVSTYRKRILEKMNMKSNHELTEYTLSNRLI